MNWYYTINRERFGPVNKQAITSLIESGKIKKDDLVWHESMGESWQTAAEKFAGLFGGTIPGPMNHTTSVATGGQTPNSQIIADTRAALSGNWGIAVGGYIIYMVLVVAASFMSALSPVLGNLIQLFLLPPLMVGLMIFLLSLARKETPAIEQIFAGFKRFWPAVGAYFLSGLFMMLWMLPGLAVMFTGMAFVPEFELAQQLPALPFNLSHGNGMTVFGAGVVITWLTAIVVSLRYAQIYFVLADAPTSGPLSAIRSSIHLMKGNKWKMVCLGFRFIGWGLLGALTLGIGFIWLCPYMMTAYARFYDDLKK